MTEPIEVRIVEAVPVRPGDAILLCLPASAHVDSGREVMAQLAEGLGDGYKILAVGGGIQVHVIRREDPS